MKEKMYMLSSTDLGVHAKLVQEDFVTMMKTWSEANPGVSFADAVGALDNWVTNQPVEPEGWNYIEDEEEENFNKAAEELEEDLEDELDETPETYYEPEPEEEPELELEEVEEEPEEELTVEDLGSEQGLLTYDEEEELEEPEEEPEDEEDSSTPDGIINRRGKNNVKNLLFQAGKLDRP